MASKQYKRKKGTSISKAERYTFAGIEYKSGLEKYMAEQLTVNKIPFTYESKTFVLQESFMVKLDSYERQANGKGDFVNRGRKKALPITYTPDFLGEGFAVETKGYANESFPMKWKMFKHLVNDQDIVLYKPQNRAECDKTVELILKNTNKSLK